MKTLKVLFGLAAIGLWFWASHQWTYYMGHRPATPLAALGFTHPLENHGAIVYISTADCWIVYGAMLGAVVCFICAALYAFGDKLHGSDLWRYKRWRK